MTLPEATSSPSHRSRTVTAPSTDPRSPTETSWECFDVSLADGVAHVQLNRPDTYNSMVPAFW